MLKLTLIYEPVINNGIKISFTYFLLNRADIKLRSAREQRKSEGRKQVDRSPRCHLCLRNNEEINYEAVCSNIQC